MTAILVDDDYPVLRYLSQSVSWETLGIELIGSYSNGHEAWEAGSRSLPDIVITDIGMPKMNGLELLENLNKVHSGFRAVILSCHNEFVYAQQAMKLRVSDYLLKESLSVEQLQAVLQTVTDELREEKRRSVEVRNYMQKEALNRSVLKEKFLKDTLQSSAWTKEDWIKQARLYGVELEAKYYLPIVIVVDRIHATAKSRKMDESTIGFAVENVFQEVLDSGHQCFIAPYNQEQLVVLICCDDPAGEQQLLTYSLQKGIKAVHSYLKLSVTCLMGGPAWNPEEVRRSLRPMLMETDHRFYLEEGRVHSFKQAVYSNQDNMHAEYSRFFSAMNDSLTLNLPDQLENIIAEWGDWVRSGCFDPGDVKEWVLQFLMDLQMKTKYTLQYKSEVSEDKLHDAMNGIHTMSHLQCWIRQYLQDLSRKLSVLAIRSKRTEVIRAQQYVIQHVTEKITLEQMADDLNLNSSYFSRLFKRETGQNFIEYVNMVKLQKGKQLLQQSRMTVEGVSDYLGYSNKSYFIKLFRRETGMTPSEYMAWH